MIDNLVVARRKLLGAMREEAWAIYVQAFTELNKHTAQNHMMTRGAFDDMCDDERVAKYVATGPNGATVGLAVLVDAKDLEAWPLASIPYFQTHWAEYYYSDRLWYLGFVCAEESKRKSGIFRDMLVELSAPARRSAGVVFADFAKTNQDLPRGSHEINVTLNRSAWFDRADWQGYWAFGWTVAE